MKTNRLKKTLAALCAAVMTLTCAAGMGMSTAGAQYATVTDDMNFRAVPRGYIMGTVPKGAQVQVLSYVDGYNKIIYNGKTGYIYGGNLSTDAVTIVTPSSSSSSANTNGTEMKVKVSSGYLRLRKSKEYRSDNELARLYNGETVKVQDSSDGTFWYVYVPSKGISGYVNKNYLTKASSGSSSGSSSSSTAPSGGETMTVKVDEGYLALRNAKGFYYENEIGSLYTGDTVKVVEKQAGTYWYVYSPKHGKYGYVNKNYLVTGSGAPSEYTKKTVSVSDGYLALRTAKAFAYENEIGELYTGDTFYVTDSSGSTYWYGYSPKHGKYGYVNKNYLR